MRFRILMLPVLNVLSVVVVVALLSSTPINGFSCSHPTTNGIGILHHHRSPLLPHHQYHPLTTCRGSSSSSISPWKNKKKDDAPKEKKKREPQQEQQNELYGGNMRQLLGLKNPTLDTDMWKVRLQLMKPVTWVPLSVIVMCGAAASGNYHWIYDPFAVDHNNNMMSYQGLVDAWLGFWTVILAGPFSEGFAQTINDYYDRDVDAINEPYRPIPSGAITPRQVLEQLVFLFVGGLSIAFGLDYTTGHFDFDVASDGASGGFPVVTCIALVGYFISYIYSAPPLKLKQNWMGALAIGLCYISFPWWCGLAVFSDGSFDNIKTVDWFIPLLYSVSGIGAAIVNDFKSMEGDKEFGFQSIPVVLGVDKAKWLAAIIPDVVQLTVASYLYYGMDEIYAAVFVLMMLIPQFYFQSTLLIKDPLANDLEYMTKSQPFVIFGLIATALCIGQHTW